MAESGITKKVLAYALKDLMAQRPLAKITVGDICDACDMNRKSFYYHFRDKYDLVNWIFYTEFFDDYQQETEANPSDALHKICQFFEKNMDFYRAALISMRALAHLAHRYADLAEEMAGRTEDAARKAELTEEFATLRTITDGYRVPADVCESYEAVYVMLREIDEAYHA